MGETPKAIAVETTAPADAMAQAAEWNLIVDETGVYFEVATFRTRGRASIQ